ncbi:MAG: hypothetical protein HFF48_05330 [Lawsonibacter sp.]|nr:hypothetical protein [Lawsonibacter sp.]
MLRAVDSYDPSRGTKFSTHLFLRLRAELSAATGWSSKTARLRSASRSSTGE